MQNKIAELSSQNPAEDTQADHDDGTSSGRRKRQAVSGPKYLEMRVMADLDMANYYGDDVINYVLTLMNVVSFSCLF